MKKNIFLILFFSLFLTGTMVSADLNEKQILSQFFNAEGLYKDQKFDEVIGVYEEILADGFKNGAVYFNLGNAYYKNGELARAILNYERAKQLMPRDSDLGFNYAYALSSVKRVGKNGLTILQKIVNRLTLNEMAIFSLVLFAGFVCVILLSIIFALPKKRMHLFAGLTLVFFLFNGYLTMIKLNLDKNQAIMLKSGEAKFEPLVEATMHFNLSLGMKVKILEGKGLWLKVRRVDGKVGWVQSNALEEI